MRIIAGTARGALIQAPEGRNTRPTLDRVRENLFNMLQGDTAEARVLDLFAGSGALSLEALSRGAARAVMVDRDRAAHETEVCNLRKLRFESRCETMLCDWRRAVERLREAGEAFDLVFLDPPYAMEGLEEVFLALPPILAPEALVILEHEARQSPGCPEGYEVLKERSWGYCGVTFYAERRKPE